MSAVAKRTFQGPDPERVMIYRLGSIGDTAVALPCFKFIRRRFASAHLGLLTNHPRRGEAPVLSVIGPMGLVDGVIPYAVGERDPREIWRLAGRIRGERPDLVIYLSEFRGAAKLARDLVFLRVAGGRRIIGAPLAVDLRAPRVIGPNGAVEPEAARLARCLEPLGAVDFDDPSARALDFTAEEIDFARRKLDGALKGLPFLAAAVGAKIPSKDWGEAAWKAALSETSQAIDQHGLVMIGGPDDRARSERLVRAWNGPVVNLCGEASPRQSAAVMARASVFAGTDGGPMHLAAASGIRCCALFGPYNRPRQWHPLGSGHRITHVANLKDVDPGGFSRDITALLKTEPD